MKRNQRKHLGLKRLGNLGFFYKEQYIKYSLHNTINIHSDKNGKVALFGMESNEYQKFLEDKNIKKVKAMKSNKLNRKQDAWTNQ